MNENTDNGKGGGLLPPLPPRQSGIIGYREQRLWALATLEILQQHAPMDKDVEVALEILRTTVSLQDHIDKLMEQIGEETKERAWHKKYERQSRGNCNSNGITSPSMLTTW
ncbi:MAG: hypothetical protein IPI29_08455 [Ignavibacteria bacterium]|nr:hypothetical protein [Ignavibacteria bacterium]